jgi:hypothetical protein
MMNTKTALALSAAIEFVTGIALLAIPDLVARVLLGAELSNSGVAVARLAGCGLLSLGVACWQSTDAVSPQATRALFAYNLLGGLYLGYLRAGGGFASYLLWPACLLHLALGLLLARPALARK